MKLYTQDERKGFQGFSLNPDIKKKYLNVKTF